VFPNESADLTIHSEIAASRMKNNAPFVKALLWLGTILWVGSFHARAETWPDVFNPFRVRTLFIEIDSTTWENIKRDTNYYDPNLNIRAQCEMWDDADTNRLVVQIRRKSDPALPDEANPQKVSLKIDVNEYVTGQEWRGLKKISLENGNGGNGVLREAMGMQLHRMASEHGLYDYQAGYSTWVRLVVNGSYVGLYASPEQRDKQFLRNRGMYKAGASWLYEINAGTFLDTTVNTTNSPTYNFLCFSPFRTACSQPNSPSVAVAMERELQDWVDMRGMLTLAAVEAYMANRDGMFTKDGKNSFAVDMLPSTNHKRRYFPWDLDAVLSNTTWDIYTGGGGGQRPYQTQILAHYWFREMYRHVFTDLLDGPVLEQNLNAFLDQLEPVLTPYLDEDPNEPGGASEFASLRQYFVNRSANVRGQIGAVTGWPRFSQNGGEFVSGFQLTLTHTNSSGVIYYTFDGSDPRGLGGITNSLAYSGPLSLTNTTHLMARVKSGTNWSALRQATFNVASHASAIKVTEIMYNPKPPSTNDDAGDYEFLELKNTGPAPVNLSHCDFTGIEFTFAPGTVVPPGGFIVLVNNPAAFAARYPGVPFHGVYLGGLSQDGERIRLRNSDGNNIVSVEYNNQPPWPLGADGFGYSLVNLNPAGNPDHPENWRASTDVNGSPGADDPAPPYTVGVIVNEVIAHTDTPLEDAIELYNPTTNAIDISGWFLSDNNNPADPTRALLKKYRFPAGTIIPAGGYKALYESDFNPANVNSTALIKFALSQFGEGAYLASADGSGNLTGHIVGMKFGASDNGVAFGRHQTSVGTDLTFLRQHTFGVTNPASKAEFRAGTGGTNAAPRVGPVVISEIMYNPASGANEFVEFYNVTGTNVDLGGWTLKGAAYVFPSNTVITASNFLVLIGTTNLSTESFRASNNVPGSVPILAHWFDLQNDGEELELSKPNDDPVGPAIRVDRVRYNDKSPWPTEADGEGPSLERVSPSAYGNDPINWGTVKMGGTPGRAGVFTNGIAIAQNSSWKYHAQSHDLGSPWQAADYSDSGWPDGDGALGFGQPFVNTTLTNAPGLTNRPVTTYFRKEFVINHDPTTISNLTLWARYDDGFVAYFNGQEVARCSLPGDAISFDTLASAHEDNGYEIIDLTAHTDKLVRSGNILAVEVHQSATNDLDLVWDAELVYSLALNLSQVPILITVAHLEAGVGLQLEWTAVAGENYRVQASSDLNGWTDLSPLITATGSTAQYVDSTAAPTGRNFYRVRRIE
jgi:hypothetical protein